MPTRRVLKIYENYVPEWTDVRVKLQPQIQPTLEEVQRTLNGRASKKLSFADWLQSQPTAYQRQFFGRGAVGTAKYEAWKRGDIILTKLPPQSPINFATLQRRNGAADPKVFSVDPVVAPTSALPRRAAARLRANAADAPEFNGNKLIIPEDIPSHNFDALSAFLHSQEDAVVESVLPRTVLRNWRKNPTSGGLRYGNGERVSFEIVIRKLKEILDNKPA